MELNVQFERPDDFFSCSITAFSSIDFFGTSWPVLYEFHWIDLNKWDNSIDGYQRGVLQWKESPNTSNQRLKYSLIVLKYLLHFFFI